jgi:hypothetical protein
MSDHIRRREFLVESSRAALSFSLLPLVRRVQLAVIDYISEHLELGILTFWDWDEEPDEQGKA